MFCCAFGLLGRARGEMRGRARGHDGMNTFVRLVPARMRHLEKTNLHSHRESKKTRNNFLHSPPIPIRPCSAVPRAPETHCRLFVRCLFDSASLMCCYQHTLRLASRSLFHVDSYA